MTARRYAICDRCARDQPRATGPAIDTVSKARNDPGRVCQAGAGARGWGVTGDLKTPASAALEFEPIARPPGDGHAVPVLRDHALPSFATCLSKMGLACVSQTFREPQRSGVRRCEALASGTEWNLTVSAVQVRQNEEVERQSNPADRSRFYARICTFLKLREAGDPALNVTISHHLR
jgi:hypothetical protein